VDKQILAAIAIGVVITVLAAYLLYDFSLTKGSISELEDYQSYFQTSSIELDKQNPIKIGILHSLSGTMAISEAPLIDAYLVTIDMINEKGGIMGREVVPVIVDGKSDWDTFAQEAERLIVEEEVDVVAGGWTSASRKAMKPIFEQYDHLLIYPMEYEGLESSENILYTGAAPNQQILPAVDWAQKNLGQKFYLVGSDYIFPRSANEIVKDHIKEIGVPAVTECTAAEASSFTNRLETPELVPDIVDIINVAMKNRTIINGAKIIISAASEFLFLDSLRKNIIIPLAKNDVAVLNFMVTQSGFSLFRASSSVNQPIITTSPIMITATETILVIFA